jgi:crotonobetainyl-CoA:carnitine CoA-transferase CaiB-like acyl-CoA transferase
MSQMMEGVSVVDLSRGAAGQIATMLLADSGAEVTRVLPPGEDDLASPASVVWDRGKQSRVLDVRDEQGFAELHSLLGSADVLVDAFAPGGLERLGLGAEVLEQYPRIVHCSITGYGEQGAMRDRPGFDALVQARTGMTYEQSGWRDRPIFQWSPLPSYGAGLLAACGIVAALRERERSGLGQRVGTSLLQGVQAWTTIRRVRVERPPDGFYSNHECRDVAPTPCYVASDGRWVHPMPDAIPVGLESLGMKPGDLAGSPTGSCEERKAWQASVQQMLLRRRSGEWLELFWAHDVRCQPVLSIPESREHPHLLTIGAVEDREVPGEGTVRQFGRAYQTTPRPGAPPPAHPPGAFRLRTPLDGLTVLDLGLALAGPYGPVLLSDLGAQVIRIDNVNPPRATNDQVWAACQRGKRSITLDLKSDKGQAIAQELVATADVIHHNMRPGVAERLGIGYETARTLNPSIIYCHVTGFGTTGPLATFPGCDQMGQALSGLEYEQGAAPAGGRPTWNRLGVGDHATAILSVLGVLEAIYRRERTGEGALIEANITGAAAFLTSHMALGAKERFPGLDRDQTGFGPLYRLYETSSGWLCLAAISAGHWPALCDAIGRPELKGDPAFVDRDARSRNAEALSDQLSEVFRSKTAAEWVDVLDGVRVPAEVASESFAHTWFDDPDLVAQHWVSKYVHPSWGRTEQVGLLWSFSRTPARLFGPPVMHGQHSREILSELGYTGAEIDQFAAQGVTTLNPR